MNAPFYRQRIHTHSGKSKPAVITRTGVVPLYKVSFEREVVSCLDVGDDIAKTPPSRSRLWASCVLVPLDRSNVSCRSPR